MKSAIMPYLNFAGNTEEAFNFYKSVLGGEFTSVVRFKDMPMEGMENLSDEDLHKIMHISLPVGDDNVLMASDSLESMGHKLTVGNNFYIYMNAQSKKEANRLFNGLSKGGSVEMPMDDVPWGSYFGMFKDRYGIQWMVSYDYAKDESTSQSSDKRKTASVK